MAGTIFHITHPETWRTAKDDKFYSSDTLSEIGFIHCCGKDQIEFVLDQWFFEWKNLILLEIEIDKLSSRLVFENLEGGNELFPHVYGPVDLDAIITIKEMKKENY